MKKIIKWLSRISGVANEIAAEERKNIGNRLIDDAYWFNGDLKCISNILTFYGEDFKENTFPDVSQLRDLIYKMDKQDLSVYKDRVVYGYWSDKKEPHFIPKDEYQGEEGFKPRLMVEFK